MNHVRIYRKNLNLKQAEFGALFGIKQSQISAIENGKRPVPAEMAVVIFIDSNGEVPLRSMRPDIYDSALRVARHRLDSNICPSGRELNGEEPHVPKIN